MAGKTAINTPGFISERSRLKKVAAILYGNKIQISRMIKNIRLL